ncbi:MAG TPA: hypothetical protein VF931_02260 [Steroidobacteraceae bacterium]
MLTVGLFVCAAATAGTINLNAPPNLLPTINCSGLVTSTFVTAFTDTGVSGEVYATETCGRYYKGTRVGSRQLQSWTSVLWDFTGKATSLPYDGLVPNTAYTETDAFGDVISDLVNGSINGVPLSQAQLFVNSPP